MLQHRTRIPTVTLFNKISQEIKKQKYKNWKGDGKSITIFGEIFIWKTQGNQYKKAYNNERIQLGTMSINRNQYSLYISQKIQ